MRKLLLLYCLLTPCLLPAQTVVPAPSQTQSQLLQTLAGEWVGLLEYRDYSEPATSTKRVQLPTWLSITSASAGQSWHYIYDDGPAKVVEESDLVTFDPANSFYSESDNGKPGQTFKVTGYDTLIEGRGQLILYGTGKDNDKPSETRITLTIRRNLLNILEEVRPANTDEPYVFRHRFVFTRAHPPSSH